MLTRFGKCTHKGTGVLIALILAMVPVRALAATDAASLRATSAIADSLFKHLQYDSTRSLLRHTLDEYQSPEEGSDTLLARVLGQFAEVERVTDQFDEAAATAGRALAIRESVLGANHPDVAASLLQLGIVSMDGGSYPRAESLLVRALTIRESSQGKDNPDLVPILLALNRRYMFSGRYIETRANAERALAISRGAFGGRSPEVARCLHSLAVCFSKRDGWNPQVRPLLDEALSILEERFGPNHPEVANILNNLAIEAQERGSLVEAVALHRHALSIRTAAFGHYHSLISQTLGNLADTYFGLRQFEKAEQLSDSMFNLDTIHFPKQTYGIAYGLMQVASCRMALGKIDQAETLLTRAEPLFVQTVGEKGPRHLYCLTYLADIAQHRHQWPEAERRYRHVLSLLESTFSTANPFVVYALCSLGDVLLREGRYAEADSTVRRGYLASDAAYGDMCPSTAEAREELARCLMFEGRQSEAIQGARQVAWTRHRNLIDVARGLPESEAFTYSEGARRTVDQYLSYLELPAMLDSATVSNAAELLLNTKGQVSDELFQRRQLLLLSRDSTTSQLADSVTQAKRLLSRLFVSSDSSSVALRCDSMLRIIRNLESRLYEQAARQRPVSTGRIIHVSDVCANLPPASTLIEYMKYERSHLETDTKESHYLALVLRNDGRATIHELGPAATIDSLVTVYRQHMDRMSQASHLPSKQDRRDFDRIGRALYAMTVQPLGSEAIDSAQTLVIAGDGSLNLISFGCLIDHAGRFLIERHQIHYLSSGRDVLRPRKPQSGGHGLLVLGDPDYERAAAPVKAEPTQRLPARTEADRLALRGPPTNCELLRNCSLPRLPGTRREIDAIRRSWSDNKDDSLYIFEGPAATEDLFKSQSCGMRILHLATHGYFLEGECDPFSHLPPSSFRPANWVDNPLLLSGLFLAGCNDHRSDTAGERGEDGVLTAYEISTMDLRGVELVTLSACESGLGGLTAGEGVYGLRRAFQVAGAQGVISALWRIPDNVAGDMMSRLYRRSEQPIPTRLRELQLSQIRKLRASGFSDHPFTWAAYIAQGDWR